MTNHISPAWPPKLAVRAERKRLDLGLFTRSDGWYKTFDRKTRYVCKPLPFEVAVEHLEGKMREWRSLATPKAAHLLTVKDVARKYLAHLESRVSGTDGRKPMDGRTYNDVERSVGLFVAHAGETTIIDELGPTPFTTFLSIPEIKGRATTTRNRHIVYVKAFANWAYKAGHVAAPINFGPDFAHQTHGGAGASDKFREPIQIRDALWATADNPLLYLCALLGITGAYQPKDLGALTIGAIDRPNRVIDFRRGKTIRHKGIPRLTWLLDDTIAALDGWLAVRPEPAATEFAELLLLTPTGLPVYRAATAGGAGKSDYLGRWWSDAVGWGYTCLRTTFATHADAWEDQLAVDVVMGQKSGHKSKTVRSVHYVKRFDAERVRLLSGHVWPLAVGPIGPLQRPPA